VLERELGRGGMATVYLAHDLKHDRPVALKVLRPELAASLGLERFLLEIRVTARLQHPHILPLLDSGMIETAAGATSPFYAMPYVEGESLRSRLRRARQLSLDEALRLAGDVASALAYAHGHGVVHRDVKPENILLSNGQAVVADFGIARAVSLAGGDRLTSTGLALGTPHYMSPEQIAGDPEVDARADVYALGCVLYEMLAGEPPFTGPTAQAVAARSLIEPAPPVRRSRPNVPEEVDGIIARALAKVPADRFADATAFGEALARATVAPVSRTAVTAPAQARPSVRSPWWSAALATAAVLAAAAVLLARRHRSVRATIAPASSIAVLPFTPSGPDTALSRLGRDLAFTLSAELDGLGGLHVVDPHTVLAHAGLAEAGAGPDRSAAAHLLGAGSLVQGSLVRVGGDVRLDLALVSADSVAAPLARATVTAPPDAVAWLTDSAARALLVQIWSHGSPPTPSLDGALRTRSVQALRAFLQGEGEITNGDWAAAAVSYERATAADPAFWLAHARDLYSLHWDLVDPPESLVAVLERHRFELPERERLSTEAILLEERDSIGEMIARARSASERYPDSWFGWLILGDELLHDGPLLGNARTDARSAFERAVTLNPALIPAWEHLMLGALADDDTVAAGRALDALTRLRAGPSLTAGGYGTQLLQFRFLDAIQRSDSTLIRALIDSVAHDPAPSAVPDGSFFDPYRYGAFAEQIAVSRKALAAAGPTDRQRVQRLLLALSWGGRGAWDSALVDLDRVAAGGADSVAALRTYGLAVAGVWLDALEPREAIARRSAAADAARNGRTGRGELAWLDGVLAAGQRDRRGLAAARAALGRSGDPGSAALDRSLGAFDASLRGAAAEAGRTMAALEWEEAALADPDFASHPLVIPLDRLAAARWLAGAGDAEEALRLLRWADGAFYLHPSTVYGLMFAGLADLERGRIEEGLGHTDLAAGYYRRFLQRYDRPVSRHAALVKEAHTRASQRTALESP
jgi:TolB-like protein/tetratricopeptide (TPR) repeat protein